MKARKLFHFSVLIRFVCLLCALCLLCGSALAETAVGQLQFTARGVNLRKRPNEEAKVLGQFAQDQVVTYYGVTYTDGKPWYQVSNGEYTGYVEPFPVMSVRFVDTARQALRQGVDSRDIVYVVPLDETRDPAPVVDQHFPAEALEEIQHARVRFVGSEHLDRHRSGGVDMQRLGCRHFRHDFCQGMIRHGVDIHIGYRHTRNR